MKQGRILSKLRECSTFFVKKEAGDPKRLEKKNAVICTQSTVDARYKKINCADEYKNIHIELKEMDWEIFNKICEGIPEEDIQIFLKASEKMLENIEK